MSSKLKAKPRPERKDRAIEELFDKPKNNGPKYEILYDQPKTDRPYTNGHWYGANRGWDYDEVPTDAAYLVYPTRLLVDIPEVRDKHGRVIAPAMKAGDMGPWVSGPDNISQEGTCFGDSSSMIVGDACIIGNSRLIGSELQGNNGVTADSSNKTPRCRQTLVVAGGSIIKASHLMGEYHVKDSFLNDVDAMHNFRRDDEFVADEDFGPGKRSQICNSIVEHADIDECQIHDSRIYRLNYTCSSRYSGHDSQSNVRWENFRRFRPGPVDIRDSRISSAVLFSGRKDDKDIPAVVFKSNVRHSEFVNCHIENSHVENSGYGTVSADKDDKSLAHRDFERMRETVSPTVIKGSQIKDFKIHPIRQKGHYAGIDAFTHPEVLIEDNVVKKSGKLRAVPQVPKKDFIAAPFDFSNDSDFGD